MIIAPHLFVATGIIAQQHALKNSRKKVRSTNKRHCTVNLLSTTMEEKKVVPKKTGGKESKKKKAALISVDPVAGARDFPPGRLSCILSHS